MRALLITARFCSFMRFVNCVCVGICFIIFCRSAMAYFSVSFGVIFWVVVVCVFCGFLILYEFWLLSFLLLMFCIFFVSIKSSF